MKEKKEKKNPFKTRSDKGKLSRKSRSAGQLSLRPAEPPCPSLCILVSAAFHHPLPLPRPFGRPSSTAGLSAKRTPYSGTSLG